MNKATLTLFLSIFLLFIGSSIQASEYRAGKDYRVVEKPGRVDNPKKIEVRSFFWFGCPHCFQLEPYFNKWRKNQGTDIDIVKTPATNAAHWRLHASAFYAAKNLGVPNKSFDDLFSAIHVKNKKFNTEQSLATFFSAYGIKKEKFISELGSFSVKTSLRKSELLSANYALDGVPAVIVAGKYVTSPSMAQNYGRLFRVVDFLIEKERALRPKKDKAK